MLDLPFLSVVLTYNTVNTERKKILEKETRGGEERTCMHLRTYALELLLNCLHNIHWSTTERNNATARTKIVTGFLLEQY